MPQDVRTTDAKKCEAENANLEPHTSAFKRLLKTHQNISKYIKISNLQAERLNIHILADAARCQYDRRQKVRGWERDFRNAYLSIQNVVVNISKCQTWSQKCLMEIKVHVAYNTVKMSVTASLNLELFVERMAPYNDRK